MNEVRVESEQQLKGQSPMRYLLLIPVMLFAAPALAQNAQTMRNNYQQVLDTGDAAGLIKLSGQEATLPPEMAKMVAIQVRKQKARLEAAMKNVEGGSFASCPAPKNLEGQTPITVGRKDLGKSKSLPAWVSETPWPAGLDSIEVTTYSGGLSLWCHFKTKGGKPRDLKLGFRKPKNRAWVLSDPDILTNPESCGSGVYFTCDKIVQSATPDFGAYRRCLENGFELCDKCTAANAFECGKLAK